MNTEESKKIKENLEKEYEKNKSKIEDLNEKVHIIERNSFENKFIRFCLLGAIPYMISLFLSESILKLNMITFNNFIPVVICLSSAFSLAVNGVINKTQGIKTKLKEFSDANNKKELLEEKIKYEIEIEKFRGLNEVTRRIYHDISAHESLLSSVSSDYKAEEENKNLDKEQLLENKKILNKDLEEKENLLNNSSIRCVLASEFKRIRCKSEKFNTLIIIPMFGAYFGALLFGMPIAIFKGLGGATFQTNLAIATASALLGAGVTLMYNMQKNKSQSKVFKKINDELEQEKISEKVIDDEDYEKERHIILDDIYALKMQLEVNKELLEKKKIEESEFLEVKYRSPKISKQPMATLGKYYHLDKLDTNETSYEELLLQEKGPVLKKVKKSSN